MQTLRTTDKDTDHIAWTLLALEAATQYLRVMGLSHSPSAFFTVHHIQDWTYLTGATEYQEAQRQVAK